MIEVIMMAGNAISLLVLARVVVSWVAPHSDNPAVQLIYRLTEPMLGPIRNLLPSTGGIDFSPMVLLIAVNILERIIIRSLI